MSGEESFSEVKKKPNRKKKNSRFLRNAKGFGKKGIFGRGTEIKDDQYHYFIGILDAMKAGFENVDDKVCMANNVFELTKDEEVHLASNQIVSKVLESLIGFVDAEHLERYFTTFADSFRPLCSNPFASHVLQKMVEISFLRGIDGSSNANDTDEGMPIKRAKFDLCSEESFNLKTKFSDSHKENCRSFVLRVSKFLLNNLEDFVWDSCGNHIIRTCVLSLAGFYEQKVAFKRNVGSPDLSKFRSFEVSSEWHELMKEFPERLGMWPHFSDFPYDENSSALLCAICIALQAVDRNFLKHFGKKILMNAFLVSASANDDKKDMNEIVDVDEEDVNVSKTNCDRDETSEKDSLSKLPPVFHQNTSVILLETLLNVAGPKLMIQLYAMLFTGRAVTLALDPLTNFAVQRLLKNIKEKDDFENVFTELVDHIEKILDVGHTAVIMEMASACLRLGCKQNQMVMGLQTAFHIAKDKEKLKYFMLCLVKMKPYEKVVEDTTTQVNLHGSLIIQAILKYNKPIVMINCIMDVPADQLIAVIQTPNGSHIVDAFMESKFVGEKSREKIIRFLEGFYIDLAISKHGSRVIETLFSAAQDPQKARIAKELSDKLNMLKSTPFGQGICSKLRIDTYRLSAAQWKSSLQQKEDKAHQLFKDIIK